MFTVGGDDFTVDDFLSDHPVKPKDVWHRGEPRRFGTLYTWSGFTLVASEAKFNEFDRQVKDVIDFIQKQAVWLGALVAYPGVEFAAFDFGVEFPVGTIIPMVDFPPDLVRLLVTSALDSEHPSIILAPQRKHPRPNQRVLTNRLPGPNRSRNENWNPNPRVAGAPSVAGGRPLAFVSEGMCHFLTIAVPGKTIPEVPEMFRRKIRFAEHRNRSVTEHTPSDWTSFTATSRGCSCDFYRASDDPPEDRSKLAEKYRKKGWSYAKIERALANHKLPPTRSAGLRNDILELVTELAHAFGQIRLSLHWYSGDVETENFVVSDVGRVTLEDFRRDTTALRNDTTITIAGEQVS